MIKPPGRLSLVDIKEFIEKLVSTNALNTIPPPFAGAIFEKPLIGVADGFDPLFTQYKNIIGDFHLTPLELMQATFKDKQASRTGAVISVVCWVLPFSASVKESNAKHQAWPPSPIWSNATTYGEKLNNLIRQSIVEFVQEHGYLAVAPVLSPLWKKPNRYVSNWSERHALYAAGMGTFSLSDGFITERGIAMRCGSVITDLPLSPTPRRYRNHTGNCLFLSKGTCGMCIERCPAKAITVKGHDKVLCREYRDAIFAGIKEKLKLEKEPDGCGLCQTGVQCESGIPASD
jgi:epoxyqueuosine reductase